MGENTLKFSGAVVHDDPNGTITINTTHNGENAGHIEMTKIGDSINLTNSKALIINITDAPMTAQPVAGEVRSYDLFVENRGTLMLNSDGNTINGFTAANEVNKFVEWSFDHNTGILSEKLVENKEAVLQDIINTPDQNQNLSNLSGSVIQDLINLTANEGADAAREAVERLVNTDSIALATAVAPNRGDNIDYTIDYNARITDQYRSHQGSLNIRVNF